MCTFHSQDSVATRKAKIAEAWLAIPDESRERFINRWRLAFVDDYRRMREYADRSENHARRECMPAKVSAYCDQCSYLKPAYWMNEMLHCTVCGNLRRDLDEHIVRNFDPWDAPNVA